MHLGVGGGEWTYSDVLLDSELLRLPNKFMRYLFYSIKHHCCSFMQKIISEHQLYASICSNWEINKIS